MLGTGVRGMRTMAGVTYAVVGNSLVSIQDGGSFTTIAENGIPGSGLVRMADNTQCLVILVPSLSAAWTYCPNATTQPTFQALTAEGFAFYGAIDCWFVDSYIVFLATNGRTFFNDDGQVESGVNQITFNNGYTFSREFGTDNFVGGTVINRQITLFGALTTEGYLDAGNTTGSPFASVPAAFMQMGMHPDAAYSAANQNQTAFWLCNDRTIRCLSSNTAVRVSNSAIEMILETANLVGCYALTPTVGGHPWYVLTMPAEGRTLGYDCLTGAWFELESQGIGNWAPLCCYNAFGRQLVGDSIGTGIGYLDTTQTAEFVNPTNGEQRLVVMKFQTGPVYQGHNRMNHRRLELVVSAGQHETIGETPYVTLYVSDDGGTTWRAREMLSMGLQGQYQARCVWWNLGQARDRCYRFELSANTMAFTVDIQTEVEPCVW